MVDEASQPASLICETAEACNMAECILFERDPLAFDRRKQRIRRRIDSDENQSRIHEGSVAV